MARYRPARMEGRSDYGRNLLVPLDLPLSSRFMPSGRVVTLAEARAAVARRTLSASLEA